MTFYLKYRPQTISDLDLNRVRESLESIAKSNSIPHALLFSGPKGTGKTSAARILAKILNCETLAKSDKRKNEIKPCGKCNQCKTIIAGNNLDVVELDAASHRGIDDVRSLREAVKLAPASATTKVYIIDEAHMLTTEAANALLKTLEEPPDHVVFILATTNPEKLPDTIRSRATNILFTKAKDDEVVRSLGRVARGEKLKIAKNTLVEIANSSDGSFRDAVKTLELLVTEKVKLDSEIVKKYLNVASSQDIDNLLDLLANKKLKEALGEVEKFVENGGQIKNLSLLLLTKLREAMLGKIGINDYDLEDFTKDELVELIGLISNADSQLKDSVIEQLPLEIAIVNWCKKPLVLADDQEIHDEEDIKLNSVDIDTDLSRKVQKITLSTNNIDDSSWQKILTVVKPKNSSTEALLRAAKPLSFDGNTLVLGVFYSFHKEKLEDNFHRMLLEDVCKEVLGNSIRISCMLTEPPPKKIIHQTDKNVVLTESAPSLTNSGSDDIIKAAKEIFGN